MPLVSMLCRGGDIEGCNVSHFLWTGEKGVDTKSWGIACKHALLWHVPLPQPTDQHPQYSDG